MRFGAHTVDLTNPAKVLFADGTTKGELVDYYRQVAPVMVPHLKGRPLTLHRFPDGVPKGGFYQKDASEHFPAWIRRADLPKKGGRVRHPMVDNTAGLVYLANQGTVAFHAALWRIDRPGCPDRIVFDLDPSGDDWPLVVDTARTLRTLLDHAGLAPYAAVTGSRGVHVVAPLDRSATADEVQEFAGVVAARLAAADDRLTTAFRKADRGGRLYLDIARNGRAQTAVAPYSVRARDVPTVAVPVRWEELDDPALRPDSFTMRAVLDRIDQAGDPWAGMGRHGRSLRRPRERLDAQPAA